MNPFDDSPEAERAVKRVHEEMRARGVKCGDCNLCCTVMRVEMAPVHDGFKPANEKCRHACKAGCSIYENKPSSCNSFICLWITMRLFISDFPMKWRPDKIGAVIDCNEVGTLTVHLKYDNAWQRKGDLHDCLMYVANKFDHVVLSRPTADPLLFHRDGSTEELIELQKTDRGFRQYRTKFPHEKVAS